MEQPLDKSVSGPWKTPALGISKELGSGPWGLPSRPAAYEASSDATLFSCSLPVLPHEKLITSHSDKALQSADDHATSLSELHQDVDVDDALEEVANQAIGILLPDDEDDLLAGIMDNYDFVPPSQQDDLEEYDLFGSLGGMELENDVHDGLSLGMSKINFGDGVVGNGIIHYGAPNGVGTVAGEHPYGEHPSRTLFVRNINSNVEDSELRILFEQYGDIRTLYTACKHRGFVMISYYDIRDARAAMRALQNKPLRRRKLDIHFSIPKDNPSEKDINQGTLVVFNLDPSVSNEDLRVIFGAYGEVKEIRETPHKRHHKFIEFYDVRAAEAALRALNRSDIAGKRIKLEPSRPGGTRRNLMLQLNQDLEPEEPRNYRHHVGSPIANSPPSSWLQFSSPVEHSPLHSFSRSPGFRTMSPTTSSPLPGLASLLHSQASNSVKIAPIGKDQGRSAHVDPFLSGAEQKSNFPQPRPVPDLKLGQFSGSTSSFGASTSNGSGIETLLSGPEFLWGSPTPYSEKPKASASAWPTPSVGPALTSNGQGHGFPYSGRHGSYVGSSHHHHALHVGSAPSGVHFERRFGFFPESPETSFMNPVPFGAMNLVPKSGSYMMNVGSRAAMHAGIAGNMTENGSPSFRMMSSPGLSPVFLGSGPYPGLSPTNSAEIERRSRRIESSTSQMENKKQFQLDLEKIASGEDARTTLMIKNIPNKYTSKMLLAAIDESHMGTYDFLYLPIDFKNKCNVGYAFINMLSPSHIIPFYEAFNGKKWEKFNSEKVASLAYARIQGRNALVAHFQNSSLMNEDKRCRPILFHSDGIDAIEQEHLPSSGLNIQMRSSNGLEIGDSSGTIPKDIPEQKPDML
ncbi:Protein MEI2-like 2 [Dionaea muscipula]